MSGQRTIVHLLRHGQVENPEGVLYGRLPGFHLSVLGREMAARAAEALRDADLVHLRCSPLERAQETMAPVAEIFDRPVVTDGRVIEAGNYLEGKKFGLQASALRDPRNWRYLRNPVRPSWGEPYKEIVARMRAAMHDAREAAAGHEALIVSHQLPVWMARCDAEGRRLAHDPRKRECTLASITSFTYLDDHLASVRYREPAADLLPETSSSKKSSKKFVAGA